MFVVCAVFFLISAEASKLESIIQTNIKKLFLLPAYIDPPPPERILRNLPWLCGDSEVMEHIKARPFHTERLRLRLRLRRYVSFDIHLR